MSTAAYIALGIVALLLLKRTGGQAQDAMPTLQDLKLVFQRLEEIDGVRIAAKWEKKFNIPPWLNIAVIAAESSGRANIKTPEGGGQFSYGLMQVLVSTARDLGYEGPDDGLLDPDISIRYGTDYLDRMLIIARNKGGGIPEAIASYNAGPTRVWNEWMPKYGDPRNFPKPTGLYVQRVLAFYDLVLEG